MAIEVQAEITLIKMENQLQFPGVTDTRQEDVSLRSDLGFTMAVTHCFIFL